MLPQLLGALNDPDASGRDIAGIIARDPALAANLLKLANSTFYRSHAVPVESLDAQHPIPPFEEKYRASSHPLCRSRGALPPPNPHQ